MNVFLGLVAKGDRSVSELLELIPRLAAHALPFRTMPYHTASWVSKRQTVALFAWNNDTAGVAPDDLIAVDGPLAATLAGYLTEPPVVDGRGLTDVVHEALRTGWPPSLGGTYALCWADERLDAVTVWNTVIRAEPVYWGETEDAVVVGTRALLVGMILAGEPRPVYDVAHLLPLLTVGYLPSDQTPFRGVQVMPPNCELTASAAGVHLAPIDEFEEEVGTVAPDERVYGDLADLLVRTVQASAAGPILCSLTGGRDSRLVVAALHRSGVPFMTTTSGFPGHPDVEVAKRVAGVLGVEHLHGPPRTTDEGGEAVIEVDLQARASRTLFASDGMLSAYENVPASSTFLAEPVRMGGSGGEFLRGGWGFRLAPSESGRADIARYMKRILFLTSAYFVPESLAAYRGFLDGWVETALPGSSPAAVVDRFWRVYHARRVATSQATRYWERNRQPLVDNLVVKAVQRIRNDVRLNQELAYNLVARLAPPLTDMPLANQRWKFDHGGPRPGDEEGWRQRTPVEPAGDRRARFNWRFAYGTALRSDLHDQIFGDARAGALFDVVDRTKLLRLFESERFAVPEAEIARLVWGAYTVSVLLTDDWLVSRPSGRVARVPVPAAIEG